jgi:hypothetical protein
MKFIKRMYKASTMCHNSTVISKIVPEFKGPPNEITNVTDHHGRGSGIKSIGIRPRDLPPCTKIKALLIKGKNTEGTDRCLTIEMKTCREKKKKRARIVAS